MKTLQVFDPPMCCSSGVCGPTADPKLVRFASDLRWLVKHGVRVERFNLSHEPQAFASNDAVRTALQTQGNACLPVVVVDGAVATRGVYPDRKQLAELTGLGERLAAESAPELPVLSG